MGLYLGDKTVNKIYLGDKTVNKIYLGDTLVWPTQGGGSHVYTGEYLATDYSYSFEGDPIDLEKNPIRNGRNITILAISLSSFTLDENNNEVNTRIPIYNRCRILDEKKGKVQFFQSANDDVIDWYLDDLGVIWTWEDNVYTAFSGGKPVQYQNVKSKLENNEYNTDVDGKKTTRKITLTVQRTNIYI